MIYHLQTLETAHLVNDGASSFERIDIKLLSVGMNVYGLRRVDKLIAGSGIAAIALAFANHANGQFLVGGRHRIAYSRMMHGRHLLLGKQGKAASKEKTH